MYAHVMGRSATSASLAALREEPGFGAAIPVWTPGRGDSTMLLWESEASARRPEHGHGGRLLNVYRASGSPA